MSSKGFITAEEVMNNIDLDESGFVYNTKKEYLSREEFEKRLKKVWNKSVNINGVAPRKGRYVEWEYINSIMNGDYNEA